MSTCQRIATSSNHLWLLWALNNVIHVKCLENVPGTSNKGCCCVPSCTAVTFDNGGVSMVGRLCYFPCASTERLVTSLTTRQILIVFFCGSTLNGESAWNTASSLLWFIPWRLKMRCSTHFKAYLHTQKLISRGSWALKNSVNEITNTLETPINNDSCLGGCTLNTNI